MTSEDVIHDFFVPAFRMKKDVVPGRYTTAWFHATRPGRYHLFCSQYCGTKHATMIGWVDVMEPAAYQAWLAGGSGSESLASAGAKLFQQHACNTCHRPDSLARGPNLEGLFGRQVKLSDGRTLVADEAYIRESIVNPNAKIVAGFQPIMPTFQGLIERGGHPPVRSPTSRVFPSRSPERATVILPPNNRAAPPATADRQGEPLMSAVVAPEPEPIEPRDNYLNAAYGVRSWLLTRDHKRIALLYLVSITFFFFLGGLFALLIRLELLTPQGDLVQAETYNKLFTMHGIVMVFFFLIPSIPAVLGNFFIPMMIGAKDLAFPRLNLLSWYIYMVGGALHALGGRARRRRHGLDLLHALQHASTPTRTSSRRPSGIFITGFSSILTGLNFIVTIHTMRAPGLTWFRLPLFVWRHYATSLIMVLGTPVIAVTVLLVGVERVLHLGIFDPAARGRSRSSSSTSSGSTRTRPSTSWSCRRWAWSRRS